MGAGLGVLSLFVENDSTKQNIAQVGSITSGFLTGVITIARWENKAKSHDACEIYLSNALSDFEVKFSDISIKRASNDGKLSDEFVDDFNELQKNIMSNKERLCKLVEKSGLASKAEQVKEKRK